MAKYISKKFRTKCLVKENRIELTPATIKDMANNLVKYLIDQEVFGDVRVYYNTGEGFWRTITSDIYGSAKDWTRTTLDVNNGEDYVVFVRDDLDPNNFFEYNGDYLSMSFEGGLYHALNYGSGRINEQLSNYFSWFGLYYEQGHAWNLSLYRV